MGLDGSNQIPLPKRQDLTRHLIEALKGLILEGKIVPGTKLPSERDLAKRFGVARPSLRQALKVLDVLGIVLPRVGDGTYVTDRPEAILRQPVEFLMLLNQIPMADLFEARLLVERSVAARAAERATTRDLAEMEQTIERLRAAKEMAVVVEADAAFHKVIFAAAGNQICRWFFAVIHESILDTLFKTSPLVDVGQIVAFHVAIRQAIQDRDAAEAERLMEEHIRHAMSIARKVRGKPQLDGIKSLLRNRISVGDKGARFLNCSPRES